jgi:hypothetical protein
VAIPAGRSPFYSRPPARKVGKFLLVFGDGNVDEFQIFLSTDYRATTAKEILAKNSNVPAAGFDNAPRKGPFIFQADPPGRTPE